MHPAVTIFKMMKVQAPLPAAAPEAISRDMRESQRALELRK